MLSKMKLKSNNPLWLKKQHAEGPIVSTRLKDEAPLLEIAVMRECGASLKSKRHSLPCYRRSYVIAASRMSAMRAARVIAPVAF